MTAGELRKKLDTLGDDCRVWFVVHDDSERDGQFEISMLTVDDDVDEFMPDGGQVATIRFERDPKR